MNTALIRFDDASKGMIDRREDDHPLPRGRTGIDDHRQGVAKAMRLQRPFRLDRPVMAPRHPADKRLAEAVIGAVIAMDPVIDHLLKRGVDRWRRAEIHIRHP